MTSTATAPAPARIVDVAVWRDAVQRATHRAAHILVPGVGNMSPGEVRAAADAARAAYLVGRRGEAVDAVVRVMLGAGCTRDDTDDRMAENLLRWFETIAVEAATLDPRVVAVGWAVGEVDGDGLTFVVHDARRLGTVLFRDCAGAVFRYAELVPTLAEEHAARVQVRRVEWWGSTVYRLAD